ncbi:DUF4286 family protein [Geofilum sp. OHC36d9]|uniref:DUF4286 family protein n=1 Tax=Geofilum sp. OHC36d9 TaxID=3458413 RepID=UPI0040345089
MAYFIFNTSFYVNEQRLEEWRLWLKEDLEPLAHNTGTDINKIGLFEVLSETPGDNLVFSFQWRCGSMRDVERLDASLAPVLQKVPVLFGDEITHFSSIMQHVL